MSLAKRAMLVFGVVLAVSLAGSISVFALAQKSSAAVQDFRSRTSQLDATMWSLRSDFYNYDDQMNMYVAVLAGSTIKDDLAETTYEQAVVARKAMGADLDKALQLAPDPGVRTELERLKKDYAAYNEFADQTRAAGQAGDAQKAVYISTRGNLEPSNDIMPTLDRASAKVRAYAEDELAQLQQHQSVLQQVSVASTVLTALMLLGMAGLIRKVLGRLTVVRDAMVKIAADNTERSVRVDARGSDEISQVGQAFNTMLEAIAAQDADLATAAEERERHMAASFEQKRTAEIQIRNRAQEVIDSTVTTVSADLMQLGEQVDTVRRGATTIEEKVSTTDTVTRTVVEHAGQADEVVTELQNSLRQVSGMAKLIAGVADQTRLLALNATIEAARAGVAGRGFSVVANEVRALAMATASSTSEITATINAIEQHSTAVGTAITTMTESVTAINDATGALRQVAADQFAVVATLDNQVRETMDRVESMSTLTERLERRRSQRVPAGGPVMLRINGRNHDAELVDVSTGGFRAKGLAGVFIETGSVVQAEFTLVGRPVTVSARVVSHDQTRVPDELAMQFDNLAPGLGEFFQRFVEGATAGRR